MFIYLSNFVFVFFIWYTIPWYLKIKTLKHFLQLDTFDAAVERHPTSGIYNFITFILNSLFRLCLKRKLPSSMKLDTKNKVNWTIEMFSFSTRIREMLTTNFFLYKLIPYELHWFFSVLTCMYLKGAHLKYSE